MQGNAKFVVRTHLRTHTSVACQIACCVRWYLFGRTVVAFTPAVLLQLAGRPSVLACRALLSQPSLIMFYTCVHSGIPSAVCLMCVSERVQSGLPASAGVCAYAVQQWSTVVQ